MKNILVLGVGNVLLKDEGIGVHVVEIMEDMGLPENVTLVNGGVSGIDLLGAIEEADKVIIVDAVDAGVEAGAVFRFNADQVRVFLNEHKTSLHQVDLFDTLKIAMFLDRCPETVIIGVQPKEITWGMELTPDLDSAVPRVIDLVLRETQASGVNTG